MSDSLFGEEYEIKIPAKKKSVKELINSVTDTSDSSEDDVDKKLKSDKMSLEEKLAIIKVNVLRILGKQKKNIIVIRDNETFKRYVDEAIKSEYVAVDTETNNSLDPVTCDLMGLCLYYPGGKQAYIPVNHIDITTGELLSHQVTEEDCRRELQRIVDSKAKVIMHNGKFDYEVLKCTCGVEVVPDWDTIVAAKLLNEEEEAGLKYLYRTYIDPAQEKYDIEMFFGAVLYSQVDPEIFAYYAATDSLMTGKLYEMQKVLFDDPSFGPHTDALGNEVKGLRWLFHEIEMPIVQITAEMEMYGVEVDTDLGVKLQEKYLKKMTVVEAEIQQALAKLQPKIDAWKLSKEANAPARQYQPKKTKKSLDEIEEAFPLVDESGKRYKLGKAKVEQISDPISLTSSTQLAILFYDILGCKAVSKEKPRGTGKEEMEALHEEYPDLEICTKILEHRGYAKMISSYLTTIPELVKHWPDGRIRFHLNSVGTETGRYSAGGKVAWLDKEKNEKVEMSGINIQNIPSRVHEIRTLFRAGITNHVVDIINDDCYEIPETDEVETVSGWKRVKDLVIGDIVVGDDNQDVIKEIKKVENKYYLYI